MYYFNAVAIKYINYVTTCALSCKLIDEFRVLIVENCTATELKLVGYYTLKISDETIMLYSTTGMISVNFSAPIADIWRVHITPMRDKNSNFIVLDILRLEFYVKFCSYSNVTEASPCMQTHGITCMGLLGNTHI